MAAMTKPIAMAIRVNGLAAMTAFKISPAVAAPRMTVIRPVKIGTMVEITLNATNPPRTPANTGINQLALFIKKEMALDRTVNAVFPMVAAV